MNFDRIKKLENLQRKACRRIVMGFRSILWCRYRSNIIMIINQRICICRYKRHRCTRSIQPKRSLPSNNM